MLQKVFFQTQSFNPSPYWDPVIVNLSGAQKFEEDTVFMPGKYKVIVNAGGMARSTIIAYPAVIEKDIIVTKPFIIRAYCGGKTEISDSSLNLGTNPYSGVFKVNGLTSHSSSVPAVNHIFGNAGSAAFFSNSGNIPIPSEVASGGNCLGDGVYTTRGNIYATASSAGSCLHLLPVGGVFGTDYLFAFHSAGVAGTYASVWGGGGSAYGGAASGGVQRGSYSSVSTYAGGSTPYGNGGAGVTDRLSGNDGTGIGNGKASNFGAGAFFDGQDWNDITTYASSFVDGKITVTYLGPTNE